MKTSIGTRKEAVLRAVIEEYIQTAQAVSSAAVGARLAIPISSATVRNIMASLEKDGFLAQLHHSSGRIPTRLAYRYYIHNLLVPHSVPRTVQGAIVKMLAHDFADMYDVLEDIGEFLSTLSHNLGVIVAPLPDEPSLFRIEAIPRGITGVTVVALFDSGLSRTIFFRFQHPQNAQRIAEIVAILNERLSGLSLPEIRRSIEGIVADIQSRRNEFLDRVIKASHELFKINRETALHISGAPYLLESPEFRGSEPEFLSRKETILDMIEEFAPPGCSPRIYISDKNKIALVVSTFGSSQGSGTIGLIGPWRMPYPQVVSIVQFTADRLSDFLT